MKKLSATAAISIVFSLSFSLHAETLEEAVSNGDLEQVQSIWTTLYTPLTSNPTVDAVYPALREAYFGGPPSIFEWLLAKIDEWPGFKIHLFRHAIDSEAIDLASYLVPGSCWPADEEFLLAIETPSGLTEEEQIFWLAGIEQLVDVIARDEDVPAVELLNAWWTAAAENGACEAMKMMPRMGADNARDPFTILIKNGDLQGAKSLLPFVDREDLQAVKTDEAILHTMVALGIGTHEREARLALQKEFIAAFAINAGISKSNFVNGFMPAAARLQNPNYVLTLLELGAFDCDDALEIAASMGHTAHINFLLTKGVSTNALKRAEKLAVDNKHKAAAIALQLPRYSGGKRAAEADDASNKRARNIK